MWCLDARTFVGERLWHDELKWLAGSHGKTTFHTIQTVEADAYVYLKVTAWPHCLADDLNSAGRCLRDLAQLLSG
jgi:hypothetical protein